MVTNIEVLLSLFKKIENKPYFILTDQEVFDWIWQMRQIVKGLKNDFLANGLKENVVPLNEINDLVHSDKIDEVRLISVWYKFLLDFYPQATDEFKLILDKIVDRSKDWWLAEKHAREKRLTKTLAEISAHDQKILKGVMQTYALDYFLAVQNIFSNSNDDIRRQLILKGYKRLPSMREDAMSNDMINKIICGLWDWFLKVKMVKDFYLYRDSLIEAKESISHDELEKIKVSLTNYCISLLLVLEKNEIKEVIPGTVSPYSRISVVELKNKLV